jgi:hypothetical protein
MTEETPINTVIKYSSYTPAQKRATQKYRENNKEKVNEQRKKYYQNRKQRDPAFLEYKRAKAKEYYQLKKQAKPEPVIVNPELEQITNKLIEVGLIDEAPIEIPKPVGEIEMVETPKAGIKYVPITKLKISKK